MLLLAAILAGCAGATGNLTRGAATPGASTRSDAGPSLPAGAAATDVIEAIVAEAAERADASPADVRVITAEEVTWSDGSLGCPEPGMMYTQALVPGYQVVVEVNGEELNFHGSQSGGFRFCESPQPPLERNPNE